MNVDQYFRWRFENRPAALAPLAADAGTGDGKTVGQVLAEMPLDCPCGWDCEQAITHALDFLRHSADKAHMNPKLGQAEQSVAALCADACVVFIRG